MIPTVCCKRIRKMIMKNISSVTFLVLLFLTQASVGACKKARSPSRYLIPKNYIGWVKAYFEVKDAPPLLLEDGHYLLRFPSNGKVETSSKIEYGVAPTDDYYYYSDDTRQPLELGRSDGKGMIWAEHNGSNGPQRLFPQCMACMHRQAGDVTSWKRGLPSSR